VNHSPTWVRPVIALAGFAISSALMVAPGSAARRSEPIPPSPYEQDFSCGNVQFLVVGTMEGMSTDVPRGPEGPVLHKEMYKATETRTNLYTGVTVTYDWQIREGDQRAYAQDDGTRVLIRSRSGTYVVTDASGKVVARAAGHLAFQLIFDTHGTATNYDDDTYVDGSFRVLVDAGSTLDLCPILLAVTAS
jgi:hypothetical protein